MKKTKLETSVKFFIAMRMTEILMESAHAISSTHEQLLWPHDEGDIILDFESKCITCMGDDYPAMLIKKLIDVCEHYDMELNFHICNCPNCSASRNQHN